MATLRDLYTQEGNQLTKMTSGLTAHTPTGDVAIEQTTLMHDMLCSVYSVFYVEQPPAVGLIELLVLLALSPPRHEGLLMIGSHSAQWGSDSNEGMHVSRNVVLYVNTHLSEADAGRVITEARLRGKNVIIRDQRFAEFITEHEHPAAFISHDSQDKAEYAAPLADGLARQLIPVWFDEYSIKVGDNVYQSIERGLKTAPRVILLLSKRFLENASWARQEFLMAVRRQIEESVLLPVWIDVDADDVRRYDLTLAGLHALKWGAGLERVVQELADAIRRK